MNSSGLRLNVYFRKMIIAFSFTLLLTFAYAQPSNDPESNMSFSAALAEIQKKLKSNLKELIRNSNDIAGVSQALKKQLDTQPNGSASTVQPTEMVQIIEQTLSETQSEKSKSISSIDQSGTQQKHIDEDDLEKTLKEYSDKLKITLNELDNQLSPTLSDSFTSFFYSANQVKMSFIKSIMGIDTNADIVEEYKSNKYRKEKMLDQLIQTSYTSFATEMHSHNKSLYESRKSDSNIDFVELPLSQLQLKEEFIVWAGKFIRENNSTYNITFQVLIERLEVLMPAILNNFYSSRSEELDD